MKRVSCIVVVRPYVFSLVQLVSKRNSHNIASIIMDTVLHCINDAHWMIVERTIHHVTLVVSIGCTEYCNYNSLIRVDQ